MPTLLSSAIYFLGGCCMWTFLEYFIHRFMGHRKNEKNIFTNEHLSHHRDPRLFMPAWKKAIVASAATGIIALLVSVVTAWPHAVAFASGISMMYLVYEALHKTAHTRAPAGWYGRWLRKHHFYHHFKDPKNNHGVTTPLWDIVFRTNVTPEVVTVPAKMAMSWLVDSDGMLRAEFSKDYRLKGDVRLKTSDIG